MPIFSETYEKASVAQNQQIQNVHCLKYIRIFAGNTLRKNEVFQ